MKINSYKTEPHYIRGAPSRGKGFSAKLWGGGGECTISSANGGTNLAFIHYLRRGHFGTHFSTGRKGDVAINSIQRKFLCPGLGNNPVGGWERVLEMGRCEFRLCFFWCLCRIGMVEVNDDVIGVVVWWLVRWVFFLVCKWLPFSFCMFICVVWFWNWNLAFIFEIDMIFCGWGLFFLFKDSFPSAKFLWCICNFFYI